MAEPNKNMSDIAMRLLCSLPKAPVCVLQTELRADVAMDLGKLSAKIGDGLKEVEAKYGLERMRLPSGEANRKTMQAYALPASGWKQAQSDGADWWAQNMKVRS